MGIFGNSRSSEWQERKPPMRHVDIEPDVAMFPVGNSTLAIATALLFFSQASIPSALNFRKLRRNRRPRLLARLGSCPTLRMVSLISRACGIRRA